MKRFQYRLDPVLRWRAAEEKHAQLEFLQAAGEYARESGVLAGLHAQREALAGRHEQHAADGVTALEATRTLAQLEGLARAVQGQRHRVAAGRRRMLEKRGDLDRAVMEREKLERHRARGEAAHRQMCERREVAALDDLNTTRHVHFKAAEEPVP